MNSIYSLLKDLVSFQSITPNDAGCQNYLMNFLTELGFQCQTFDNPPVANFFARLGTQEPLLVFAGHTDVVPVGAEHQWLTNPFELTEIDGLVYGRGTADMKGSLAAMMVMAERFVNQYHDFSGSLGFLITSAEEGDLFDQGTPYVMEQLHQLGIKIDYCIVGEPTSSQKIADVIKIGRRGSLTGKLKLEGKQGHVAYPHLAINPIHQLAPALAKLTTTPWDNGNDFFPPTSLQITRIQAGGQASNIIPGELLLEFNFRFSTEQTALDLQNRVIECFNHYDLHPIINWRINGEPFLTSQGKLKESCINVIEKIAGYIPILSTDGGTSDGRFIAPYGVEVIELGPINKSIHQVNEYVSLADLDNLSTIYLSISEQLLII